MKLLLYIINMNKNNNFYLGGNKYGNNSTARKNAKETS